MRAAWILATLALSVLAGCFGGQTERGLEAPEVDAAAVLADLRSFVSTYGERADNTEAHIGAREHLAAAFDRAGLEVWRQNFTRGIEQENIVGIQWGQVRDEWVVVGGHYDIATRDCNQVQQVPLDGLPVPVPPEASGVLPCGHRAFSQGAYDDGSGTMMTVHLAQRFAALDPHYTIAFVAFDGEERGLEGSSAFTETIVSGESPYGDITFRGMIDLDMIGLNWPGVDAPIYFDANSMELEDRLRQSMAELDVPEDMVRFQGITLGRSDYHWFFELGIPTGFFISNFEEWQLPGDAPVTTSCVQVPDGSTQCSSYPFWHIEDTYDTMLQMAGSEEDLQAGFQTALEMAADQIVLLASEGSLSIKAEDRPDS